MKAEDFAKGMLENGCRVFKKDGNYTVVSDFGFGMRFTEDEEIEDDKYKKTQKLVELSGGFKGMSLPDEMFEGLGEELFLKDFEGNDKLRELIEVSIASLEELGEGGEVSFVIHSTDRNWRQLRESLEDVEDISVEITTMSSEHISVVLEKDDGVEEDEEDEYTPEELWVRQVAKAITGDEEGFNYNKELDAYFTNGNSNEDEYGDFDCGCEYYCDCESDETTVEEECELDCCNNNGDENKGEELHIDTPFGTVIIRKVK